MNRAENLRKILEPSRVTNYPEGGGVLLQEGGEGVARLGAREAGRGAPAGFKSLLSDLSL